MNKLENFIKNIAEPILKCRACSFIRMTKEENKLFYPSPGGYTNLNAPVMVIGYNEALDKNYQGGSRNELECIKDNLNLNDYDAVHRHYKEKTNRDPMEFKVDKYYRPAYELLCNTILSSSATDEEKNKFKNDFWQWVFYTNVVRCPSENFDVIPNEEFENCHKNGNNKLLEEICLIKPKIIITYHGIRDKLKDDEWIKELLTKTGYELKDTQEKGPFKYKSNGSSMLYLHYFYSNSQKLAVLETLHPNAKVNKSNDSFPYYKERIEMFKKAVEYIGYASLVPDECSIYKKWNDC